MVTRENASAPFDCVPSNLQWCHVGYWRKRTGKRILASFFCWEGYQPRGTLARFTFLLSETFKKNSFPGEATTQWSWFCWQCLRYRSARRFGVGRFVGMGKGKMVPKDLQQKNEKNSGEPQVYSFWVACHTFAFILATGNYRLSIFGGILVLAGLDVLHPDHVLGCFWSLDSLGWHPLLLNATSICFHLSMSWFLTVINDIIRTAETLVPMFRSLWLNCQLIMSLKYCGLDTQH